MLFGVVLMASSRALGYKPGRSQFKSSIKNSITGRHQGPNILETEGFAMLHRRPLARLFGLAVSIVLLAVSAPLKAQESGDIYTVRDVEVDVTADNSAAARDRAITEAQRKAFDTLYGRLSPEPGAKAPPLSDIEVARLVQDFEVQRERSSAVRYLATLTVRFRPANVRSLLQTKGASYVEIPQQARAGAAGLSGRRQGAGAVGRPDALARGLENFPPPQGMVPIVVPYGELADIADISAATALEGNQAGLSAIAERYQAGDVLVALLGVRGAEPDPSAPNTVKLTRYAADGTKRSDTVTVPAATGPDGGCLSGGRSRGGRAIAGGQVAAGQYRGGGTGTGDAGGGADRQPQRLGAGQTPAAQVPTVSRVELMTLTRDSARVELYYRGSPEVLGNALAHQDLSLTERRRWTREPSKRDCRPRRERWRRPSPCWVRRVSRSAFISPVPCGSCAGPVECAGYRQRTRRTLAVRRQWMSIPNIISLGRLLSVPLAVWLILVGELGWAFWLFVASGLSDAMDGFMARAFRSRTALGGYLDPIADKALLVSVYLALGHPAICRFGW